MVEKLGSRDSVGGSRTDIDEPVQRDRLKSWKEYEANEEIPMILSEGFLPIKFQNDEFKELDYEGALRFYFDDGKSELTKAVRLTNRTTVEELIPTLITKFSLPTSNKFYSLYEIENKEAEPVLLFNEECPLARAISTKKVPRFVLRETLSVNSIKPEDSVSLTGPSSKKDKSRKKLFRLSGALGDKNEGKKKKEGAGEKSKKSKKDKNVPSVEIASLREDIEGSSINEVVRSDKSDTSIDEIFDQWDKEDSVNEQQENSIYTEIGDVSNSTSVVSEEPIAQSSSQTVESEPVDNGHLRVAKVTRTLSFSNSSIFYEQDNDPANLEIKGRPKKGKKKTPKSTEMYDDKRNSKSISKMFNKKKQVLDTTELSTNQLAPGILKIFGDHVSEGSNYKAVRATSLTTASEVVKMALERYGFENADPNDYVLCDVVGRFENPEQKSESPQTNKKGGKQKKSESGEEQVVWNTEYIRVVNDNEKPIVLLSLWKPTNGRSRRFELRNRTEIDTTGYLNTADGPGRRDSETSLFEDSEVSGFSTSTHNNSSKERSPLNSHRKNQHNKSSGRVTAKLDNQAPLYTPYLLLIQGFRNASDKLIHKLSEATMLVGPYSAENKQYQIMLFASDILEPQCWIYKKISLDSTSDETNLDDVVYDVFVEPAQNAYVTVDGASVESSTQLKPGSILGLGKSYLFLFKDPTQQDTGLPWVKNLQPSLKNGTTQPNYASVDKTQPKADKSCQVEIATEAQTSESEESTDDEEEDSTPYQAGLRPQVNKSALAIEYDISKEDDILHTIIDISEEDMGDFKLTPAYLFMMVIEHSAAKFTEIQTRKLLLKISSGLQGIAWEKTKEIGKQVDPKEKDPVAMLDNILPDLGPVLFWMAGSIEMLHYLQGNINKYLLPADKVKTSKEALISADEELLTVLEEVIMFTFQQTVYHLTKVLYAALPAIIDTNPFKSEDSDQEEQREADVHPAVEKITQIFSKILQATRDNQVHSHITMQLFAYLFFFSNASLFNSLMEKGSGGEFYRWAKGVQLRANLDCLEDWAQAHGLATQFEKYMAKINGAVDLLSCPKMQLFEMDWETMRSEYASLNPAQLQQLLAEYQLSGKPRPRPWYPPPEQVEPALRSEDILESFATHPPLMLPATNFVLNLNKLPESDQFQHYHQLLREKAGEGLQAQNGNQGKLRAKKERSKSKVDMNQVEEAITMVKESQVESGPPAPSVEEEEEFEKPRVHFDTESESESEKVEEKPSIIKSIQVQSKKTTKVTISSRSTSVSSAGSGVSSNAVVSKRISMHSDIDDDVTSTDVTDPTEKLLVKAQVLLNEHDVNGNKDVFVVNLIRGSKGLGLGLIDGMFTSLKSDGIYIRTVVPDTPAAKEPLIAIGDRVLAVNGTTLIDHTYNQAMDLIKRSGDDLSFLLSKSDDVTIQKIVETDK